MFSTFLLHEYWSWGVQLWGCYYINIWQYFSKIFRKLIIYLLTRNKIDDLGNLLRECLVNWFNDLK